MTEIFDSLLTAVSDSYTTIPGNAVRHVDAGSLLNITCLVVNFPLKLDYMIFYHNDQVFYYLECNLMKIINIITFSKLIPIEEDLT